MDFKVIKLPPKLTKNQLETINFHSRKLLKSSLKTTRFLKNKNIVEFNKENIEVNNVNTKQQIELIGNSKRNSIINVPKPVKTQRSTMTTCQRNSLFHPDNKQSIFSPRIKEQIIKRHAEFRKTHFTRCTAIEQKPMILQSDSKPSLQKLLIKNNIPPGRSLMGMNIPQIQQTHQFSRFDLFNLYTYYKTLLQSSNRSVSQLRKGFQSIMYMNQIELNCEMIERMFSDFLSQISFANFIKVYGNIQNLLFTQNIIEYMLTVFNDFYKEQHLSSEKIFQALKDKLDLAEALEIKNMLYLFYGRRENHDLIQVKEILHACSQNLAICKRIFNGINKLPPPKVIS